MLQFNPAVGLFEAIDGVSYQAGDFGGRLDTFERWSRGIQSAVNTGATVVGLVPLGKAAYSVGKYTLQGAQWLTPRLANAYRQWAAMNALPHAVRVARMRGMALNPFARTNPARRVSLQLAPESQGLHHLTARFENISERLWASFPEGSYCQMLWTARSGGDSFTVDKLHTCDHLRHQV